MDKELEALERIKKAPTSYREEKPRFAHTYFQDLGIVESALKVLEIIKNKKVDTHSLRRLNLEEYNYGVMLGKKNIPVYECELLTLEEYNLLKDNLQ